MIFKKPLIPSWQEIKVFLKSLVQRRVRKSSHVVAERLNKHFINKTRTSVPFITKFSSASCWMNNIFLSTVYKIKIKIGTFSNFLIFSSSTDFSSRFFCQIRLFFLKSRITYATFSLWRTDVPLSYYLSPRPTKRVRV